MSKVLVTGANGFLGAWLTQRLVEEGHEVFCLVRPTSDLTEIKHLKIQYKHGDVTNAESVGQACQGMDSVFHLAGLVAYKKSDRPQMDLVNVQGTQNVVDACVKSKVRRLVHLSSVVAVGAGFHPQQILNENSPYNIGHLNLGYFETKHQAEQIVKNAVQQNQLDSVMLNPSTIYGPADAKKGSRKSQVKVAQGKLKFYTSGGVSVVAVEDVVQGIISAWKKGRSGERYILSGENLLIKDLFKMIAELAGRPAPPFLMPGFALHTIGTLGDWASTVGLPAPLSRENAWTATLYHWFDHQKAKNELGFNPQSAKIALSQSVEWMRQNGLLN